MPRTRATRPRSQESYWGKRVSSTAFKRALTDTLTRELQSLAKARVADVLDAELIRTAIQEWDARLVNRDMIAELIIQANRRVTSRLSRKEESLFDVLDRQLVADIEALLAEQTKPSAQAEKFVGNIMQQEFVRRLFTDIIFTAIVSFNQKINPFFGALTVRVLEDQIKGFIRLFMPMLIEQATAFAVSRDNQRLALDFARQIIRQLLDQPLRNFAIASSPAQRKQLEAIIRKAVANTRVETAIRAAALAAWEDFHGSVGDKRVGDLVRLDEQAAWLAGRMTKVLLPVLARPHIIRLVATELTLAAGKPQPS